MTGSKGSAGFRVEGLLGLLGQSARSGVWISFVLSQCLGVL